MNKTAKIISKERRKLRIKKKVLGTTLVPRLSVYKSNKNIYIQLIDDSLNKTLVGASSVSDKITQGLMAKSTNVVEVFYKRFAKQYPKNPTMTLVYDRNGMKYHGVVKNIAEKLREKGFKF